MKGGLGTLQYDGLSRLRHIERADGATIDYLYRPDGALLSRNVVCNSALDCEPGKTSFVYDGLLLRETYNTTGATPVLTGRYYYADEADIPVAADLADPVTHVMRRVYFVADRMGSVVGVLDAAGNWLERTRFGLYGLPEVEAVDTTASILSTVCGDAAGDLRLVFTEPVLPPTTQSATTTIEAGHGSYDDALTVKASAPVSGTWTADSGSPCGINAPAIRFHPDVAIPPGTTVSVVLNTAGLVDRWRNSIETATVSFTAAPGIVYVGPPIGWTASTPSDRSSVGNVLAFQGHLWDADAGLYLARARVLSPVTGAFLSRDPSGFSDSVNMYGALRNDPVNHRDPTGRKLILHGDLSMLVRELAEISGLVLRVCDKDEARRLGCDVGELRSLGIRAPGRGRVSMLAMNILLDAIEDPEVIEVSNAKTIADPKKPGESSAVEFGAAIAPNRRDRKDPAEVGKRTLWDFVAGPIVLDLEDWQYAWGFGWASHTPGLVFLHELTHLAIPYGEERPFADPTKEELKADRWATGRVVDLTNEIATELGLAERLHYQDYRERADPPTTRTLLFSGGRRFQWNRELARSRGPAQ
ncbi:MAG: hypothetical protein IT384_10490 [Deltaproteobacteria bacterium]|nr:hypothetical protein [Deltaproteobacteria bacterium]